MKKIANLVIILFIGIFNVSYAQQCNSVFTDNGGTTANYLNSSNATTTICPDNAGDFVTVTFTAFDTESTWDGLYVYDGNTITAPQISSTNGVGNGPLTMPGAFWGTAIPGPFSSTSQDGCLTFRFLSDGGGTRAGWVADVTCAPVPICTKPNNVNVSNITATSASLIGTNCQILILVLLLIGNIWFCLVVFHSQQTL